MSTQTHLTSDHRHRYLRVKQIVAPNGLLPISRSSWYAWRAEGRISKGLRLGPRTVVWPETEVLALLEDQVEEGGAK